VKLAKGIGLLFCLVSLNSWGAPLSILVFKSEAAPAYVGKIAPPGTEITVYDMDAKARADRRLNLRVSEIVQSHYKHLPAKDGYTRAFSDLLNSAEWYDFNQALQVATEPVDKAMRHRIKKLPAYVFDHEYIIYGVPSLQKAMALYERNKP
tara:strand:+ start:18869 stop:19321 length:453 start_codon:yes stop_codon:yes gene_type:complete